MAAETRYSRASNCAAHFRQQRLVGKLHGAAQRKAEELAAKLSDEGLAPLVRRGNCAGPRSPPAPCRRSAWPVRSIGRPASSRSRWRPIPSKLSSAKPKASMRCVAARASRASALCLLRQLPHGQGSRRLGLRKGRHIFRRARDLLAEQRLDDKVAAQDGAGARSARLLRQHGRLAEQPAARIAGAPPLRAASRGRSRPGCRSACASGSFR